MQCSIGLGPTLTSGGIWEQPWGMRWLPLVMLGLLLGPMGCAQAAAPLSGSYRGSITYMPKDGATHYDDTGATMVIQNVEGKGPMAVVTYSDQLGRYRETCTMTSNADGTITLQGVSWKILSGSSFSPDTFTVRVQSDGSVKGTSVDTSGGTSTLSMKH
jgi:hypothetical protein